MLTDTTLFKGSKVKHDSGTECCLSLCQAVSFLPAAEEDEEMMMRKEDGHGKGKYICIFIIIVLIMNHTNSFTIIASRWFEIATSFFSRMS